jgi:ketosteroid isomerase-like protein
VLAESRGYLPVMTARKLMLALGLTAAPGDLQAQIPGESVYGSKTTFRQEYLERTFREVTQALDDWTKAVERGDPKRIKKLVAEELLFSPLSGWLARGKDAIDSLASYLPRISSFGISPFDFDASGAMASIYASVYYQLARGDVRETVVADAVIVLLQRGDTWKVRSYVERPRPVEP